MFEDLKSIVNIYNKCLKELENKRITIVSTLLVQFKLETITCVNSNKHFHVIHHYQCVRH